MLFELENGLLLNIIQIIAIRKMEKSHNAMLENGAEIIYEYLIYTVDKSEWYATKKDVEQLRKEQKK